MATCQLPSPKNEVIRQNHIEDIETDLTKIVNTIPRTIPRAKNPRTSYTPVLARSFLPFPAAIPSVVFSVTLFASQHTSCT